MNRSAGITSAAGAWKRLLLALCAFAVVLWSVNLFMGLRTRGAFQEFPARTGSPYTERFFVLRGGAAFRGGLRTGDTVDVRALPAEKRYHLIYRKLAGEVFTLPVHRRARSLRVTITAANIGMRWDVAVGAAADLWAILFATILAWRRPDSAEARVLCLVLVLVPISGFLAAGNWATPWLPLDVAANVVAALTIGAPVLLAVYASLFGRPLSPTRRTLLALSCVVAAALAAQNVVAIFAALTAVLDPLSPLLWAGIGSSIVVQSLDASFIVLLMLCALLAIRATPGEARGRLIWVSASFFPLYLISIATFVLSSAVTNFAQADLLLLLSNVAGFLVPVGFAYSLLNRRLLDIGFALNRAAVFSGVSLVIVGVFVLAEWALGEWFNGASHSENIAINAGLALLLGFSVRAIHKRVDSAIDTLFFRKRHDDERAIRAFARSAPYISDRATLLQRAAETLEQHADAAFVAFALDDGAGHYGDATQNDSAVLALRADGDILDLRCVQTSLEGEFAYPMLASGRFVGALILGPKRSGESYAPDESEAILQLAQSIAATLDIMSTRVPGINDALLTAVQDLSHDIRSLRAVLGPNGGAKPGDEARA